jgi:hypothetical protein
MDRAAIHLAEGGVGLLDQPDLLGRGLDRPARHVLLELGQQPLEPGADAGLMRMVWTVVGELRPTASSCTRTAIRTQPQAGLSAESASTRATT